MRLLVSSKRVPTRRRRNEKEPKMATRTGSIRIETALMLSAVLLLAAFSSAASRVEQQEERQRAVPAARRLVAELLQEEPSDRLAYVQSTAAGASGGRALGRRHTSSSSYNEIDPRGSQGTKKQQQQLLVDLKQLQQHQRWQQQQPPNELLFSNQTGAVVQCGVALELAKSIARAERQTQSANSAAGANGSSSLQASSSSSSSLSSSSGSQTTGFYSSQQLAGSLFVQQQRADIEVRWEKENGEQVEQTLYAGQGSSNVAPLAESAADLYGQPQAQSQSQVQQQQQRRHRALLRFVRPSDGALVFEPFRANELRPDVHMATYRCVASSSTRGASVVSRDLHVRAVLAGPPNVIGIATNNNNNNQQQQQQQLQPAPEVPDELVIEGNNAVLKCQVPAYAQDYIQPVDWVEYPSETTLSYQSTTLANANHLFSSAPQQQLQHVHRRQKQLTTTAANTNRSNNSIGRYFVAPKSGDLHILNVDSTLNYRSYKCRCKNKLTGELVTSANRGKLIVTESHSTMAPRLLAEAQMQQSQAHLHTLAQQQLHASGQQFTTTSNVYEEGELALLACNLQAFPRAQVSWFRRLNELDTETVEQLMSSSLSSLSGVDADNNNNNKYALVSGLLLINRVSRNDSGTYLCQAKNSVGEERLEMELPVRGQLKAKLTASASVLELGRSLALECTVTGYPIHQVIFRHNQNVIKSISGSVGVASGHNHHYQHHQHLQHQQHQHHGRRTQKAPGEGNYFVVDSAAGAGATNDELGGQLAMLASENNRASEGTSTSNNLDRASNVAANGGDAGADDDDDDDDDNPSDSEQGNQVKLSHVIVIVLEPQHAGAYQCFAYNQYESVQSSAYIRVLDDPPKFKETFRSQVFEQRQDISLQCSARANPLPEITWSIDEQPIPESSRIRFGDFVTKDNLVISYVNISQTQVTDSGQYRCTADNGLAQVSHQAQISVTGPLQIKPMPNMTVVASTSLRIRCPVAGYPVGEIQWQHNGRRLPANHRQHVYENGTLEVEHMEKSQADEGEYTCLATSANHQQQSSSPGSSNGGGQSAYGSVHISIKVRPTIEPFTISRSLREGQRASVMCTISSGDLPISISWFRNDQPLVAVSTLAAGLGRDSFDSSDSTAVVALGAPQVATGSGSGTGMQQQSGGQAADSTQVLVGGNFSNLLPGVRISRVSDYSSTLLFESVLVQHSGNYTCLARNDAGSVSHQAPMIVQVAPKWSIEPSDTNVVRGSSMSIDCMASGFPPPRIIWTKATSTESSSSSPLSNGIGSSFAAPVLVNTNSINSGNQQLQREGSATGAATTGKSHHLGSWRSIVSSPHLQVYENGSLNILDARDSDLGYYMCQAANGVGPGLSKVIKVTINVAAQFSTRHSVQYIIKGEQAHLKCQAKGDWPMAVHWFKSGNRLEPVNVQEQEQQLQMQSSPNSANAPGSQQPLSATSASLLLVPGAGSLAPLAGASGGAMATGSLIQPHKLKGSVLEQINALLAETTLQQQQQQHQPGGLLMQRYSLTNTEIALNSREAQQQQQQQQQQLQTSQQQPLIIQLSSLLSINQVERQDTGTFKCLAANHFGFDERSIQLIVQDVPDKIEELSVLEVNSRSITLGWLTPYDGNTPITSYHIQYKPAPQQQQQKHAANSLLSPSFSSSPSSSAAFTLSSSSLPPSPSSSPSSLSSSSSSSSLGTIGLSSSGSVIGQSQSQAPAGGRVVPDTLNSLNWFNHTFTVNGATIGASSNSNDLTNIKQQPPAAVAGSATTQVNQQQQQQQAGVTGGQIIAYQQQQGAGSGAMRSSLAPSGGRSLVKVTISLLRPVTHYWFRVGAENKLGHGSMSTLIESITMEEAPGAAPSKLKAVAQSSSSILVSWLRISDKEVFGSVHGYYVAYKPLLPGGHQSQQQELAAGSPNKSSAQQQLGPQLVGANNLATQDTQQQEQQQPVTNIYKTIAHDDKLNKFDALLTGLKRSTKYVISVQAFNARGTGPATEPIVVQTLDMDPPKQVRLYVKQASNCSIQLEWRPMSQAALIQQQQQLLQSSGKPQAISTGVSMSATTATPINQKSLILPLAMPLLQSASSNSNQDSSAGNNNDDSNNNDSNRSQQSNELKQQQQLQSAGGQLIARQADLADVVDYYSLYQAELNERPRWQEIRLPGHASSHTIDNLRCGTRYQFYMMGVNRIGVGDQSDILDTKTTGGLPLAPDRQSTFDVVNTTCYIIRLDHWQDNGCPIREFNVRFRQESAREWIQLAHYDLMVGQSSGAAESTSSIIGATTDSATSTTTTNTTTTTSVSGGDSQNSIKGSQETARQQVNGAPRGYLNLSDPNDKLWSDEASSAARFKRTLSSSQSPAQSSTLQEQNSRDFAGDVYVLPLDDSRDDEDSFLDYSVDGGETGVDYAGVESTSDQLEQQADDPRSLLEGNGTLLFSSLSNGEPMEQNSQLFSLLKDSMLPTFDSKELIASSSSSVASLSSTRFERHQLPADAQEWQTSNFIDSSQQASGQSFVGDSKQSISFQEPTMRIAHATRMIVTATANNQQQQQQEWRRVRFCNLIENVYYSVQVTAMNSVGETEAELRILTSQEGLEYDQEIKRQVVGKLGGDRVAQSIAMGNRAMSLFSLDQWPVLVPISLTIILMTIIVVITLLLKRSNPSGSHTSTTTTTTTTTMDSSSSHCQSYLNESHAGHHGNPNFKGGGGGSSGGAPSAITEATVGSNDMMLSGAGNSHCGAGHLGASLDAARYTLSGHGGMIDNYSQNGNMSIYQQRSNQSVFDEPAYGVVGGGMTSQQQQLLVNVQGGLQASTNGGGSTNETNRSSGSPATTTNTTSMHSGSSSGQTSGGHLSHAAAMFMRHSTPTDNNAYRGQQQQQEVNSTLSRGRNVYLCATATKEESGAPKSEAQIFYGMAPNPQVQGIYGQNHQATAAIQLRHYQQEESSQQNGISNSKQQDTSYPLYGGHQQLDMEANVNESTGASNSKNIVDNCFMTIVEEVARANDSLVGQQQQHRTSTGSQVTAGTGGAGKSSSTISALQTSCHSCNNPLDCFHQQLNEHHHQSTPQGSAMSNYVPAAIQAIGSEQRDESQLIKNSLNHHQNQTGSAANKLMFDPVYATIRRTFPQAFRYLTLQQQHHYNHNNNSNANQQHSRVQQQQHQGDQLICNQRNSLNDDPSSAILNQFIDNQQHQQVVHDMAMFNSNNLAALNLLTPTTTTLIQQHQHSNSQQPSTTD